MTTQLTKDEPQRYADWVIQADHALRKAEVKNASCVDFCCETLEECYDDPATHDLTVSMSCEGEIKDFEADLGFGFFRGPYHPGNFGVTPHHHPAVVRGGGPFTLIHCSFHWDKWSDDCARLSKGLVPDFKSLHAQVNRDEAVETLMRLGWDNVSCQRESSFFAETIGSAIVFRLLLLSGQLSDREKARLDKKTKSLNKSHLRKSLEYIHELCEFGDVGSLAELAELCDLSRFQFSRRFTASTGLTPSDYLLRLRIEAARHRLNGGDSIVQAALATGFSDQAHLTRQFKRIHSITPGRYRRELKFKRD